MKLKQLSIFLENAPDRFYQVAKAFGDAGINLRANCICNTSHDFGVLRILVSDLASARSLLMERFIPARVDEVVAIELEDNPGSLSRVLELFLGTRVSVEYMYAVAGAALGKAVMIFCFNENESAAEILKKHGFKLLDAEAFGMLDAQVGGTASGEKGAVTA